MSGPNTLSTDTLERQIADLRKEVRNLWSIVQGQPIRSARIEGVSGGQVTTGTLLIKDGVDGPEISVVDASNNEIVKISEVGIEVLAGNIAVNNVDGDPILDGIGLVSENNFDTDSALNINLVRPITSTTFANIAGALLTFTLPRDTVVLFLASGNFTGTIADGEFCSVDVALEIDGALFPDSSAGFGNVFTITDDALDDVTNVTPTWHGHYITTLSAGPHTVRLKNRIETGSVDGQVTSTMLSYLLLGKRS